MTTPFESMIKKLRDEIEGHSMPLSKVWSEVSRQPQPISPQEEASQFMSMSNEQLEQMIQQVGPDKYMEFVKDGLGKVAQFDPTAADALAPYFMQHLPQFDMQTAFDDTEPISIESEIDKYLEQDLELPSS